MSNNGFFSSTKPFIIGIIVLLLVLKKRYSLGRADIIKIIYALKYGVGGTIAGCRI